MNDQERYIKLNWQQQYALDCMLAGQNVFLTGKAGTGKSAVINRLVSQSPKHVVKLAPTGVAAQNIGGSTVHSFFQLPIPFADPERPKQHRRQEFPRKSSGIRPV